MPVSVSVKRRSAIKVRHSLDGVILKIMNWQPGSSEGVNVNLASAK